MKAREAFADWLRNLDAEGLGYRLGRRLEDLADKIDPPKPGQWTQMGWIDEVSEWGGFPRGSIFMAPLQPPKPVTMPDIEEALKGLRFRQPVLPSIKLKKEAIDRLLKDLDVQPQPFQRHWLEGGMIRPLNSIDIVEDDDAKD